MPHTDPTYASFVIILRNQVKVFLSGCLLGNGSSEELLNDEMMKKYSLVVGLLCYSAFDLLKNLNPEEAVKIALENNFGIQISKNLESQAQTMPRF